MIPANLLPVAKVAALPLLTAIVVGSCTAQHFRVKINNMELEWTAKVAQAQARAAEQIARQERVTNEAIEDAQRRAAALDARYADAAERLRNAQAQANAARVRAVSHAAGVSDGEAPGDGLLVGSREPDFAVAAAEGPYLLQMPLEGTLDLLRACDENTQKLIGLQLWVERQQQTGEAK